MARRTRAEMEETRATLLATARRAFAETGYTEASMDDLTAQAGLTRGALYHHFGDKKGLLAAVVAQIDGEMDERLKAISDNAKSPWQGLRERCRAYLRMALEPEIQRIVLRDARAVLGGTAVGEEQHCIASLQGLLEQMGAQPAEALARLIYGSLSEAAFWIAEGDEGETRLAQADAALKVLLRAVRPEQD
ncbi:TetR family transcriptional regulator [Pseudomonas sp. 1239]|uniref:TetR/AcrR family transcriptional regulator n=1 Tax=Pseudomonas TaxID=286 RepID=UPI0005C25E10|nr:MULTISPECIES: TetR family transcriptional regulator [Pseudomonas]KIU52282.1 TetR family transcriptional regulator [Pseudomonas putida]OUM35500.1 TetR family transcriptional regulator [Pseudomonas sp. 1239]WKL66512.1 TetR family transcriptional regulator [Pseudomonas qingdaonensis]